MGSGSDMQTTAASGLAPASPSGADRWLRPAGTLLAVTGAASAVAGALHHPPGPSEGAVALAVTLCACAVLVAWAFAPVLGVHRTRPGAGVHRPSGVHRTPLQGAPAPQIPDAEPQSTLPLTAESTPPTITIARPAGDWQPLAAPPRPLYALDELAATETTDAARSPFLDDPLFRLEDPGPGAWLARLGKDPTQLCQDSFACDPARRVYAVTDGVSQSFMPAAWARIVAQAAVAHPGPFRGEADFAAWLGAAADRWRAWMRDVWLPRARASTGRDPERASTGRPYERGDWGDEIDGQGAQTTLICCSVGGNRERGGSKSVRVDVTAIGDAECLLFRQSAERWELVGAFPLEHPSDFGVTPATLGTRRGPARVAAMYRNLCRGSFAVCPGDRLVLATDAVACWLLTLAPTTSVSPSVPSMVNSSAWPAPGEDLIARALESPTAFERLAQAEIDAGRLEDDDLSLLVIAIP